MTERTFENTAAIIQKWLPLAADVEETPPGMPVTVLVGEALDLSYVLEGHWDPISGKDSRPGMRSAVESGLLDANITQELRELVTAVSQTQAQYRAVTASNLEAPVERGEFLLSEMKQCLEFIFDDGVDDVQDAELARLSESHTDASSHDALAMSIEGFAMYANRFRDRLAQLPEFDAALLDEALVVAHRLRAQSSLKLSSAARDRQREELAFRNRLITLMLDRMNKARRAAHFVFRHHPDVARLTQSAYQRRRRNRYQRRTDEVSAEVSPEVSPQVNAEVSPEVSPEVGAEASA